ncbi:uncharacterized protein LOC135334154 [Halichondria panicea]|uniref:uncharacterized protein LOC135334154 n=1 Tax=Halichondria panicea TaxID=6063 RepID=UPI00312BAE81
MEETKVIYYIDDEETPYLMKIGKPPELVTLGDFKGQLNRTYIKFFFKSEDDDFGVVKEELAEDDALLPQVNGRVVCWVITESNVSGSEASGSEGDFIKFQSKDLLFEAKTHSSPNNGGVKFHGSLRSPAPLVPQGTQRGPVVYPAPLRTGSATHHPPSASLPVGVLITAGGGSVGMAAELCFLCEDPIDIKFEPCGHAVMCSACAQRTRKCPICKAAVKTISKLSKVCVMCNEEEATATVKPCDHTFCPECARRMKTCFECRVLITAKEGLPPVSATSVHPLASPDSESKCPICLTEPKNTSFLCRHQTCWDCAQKVDHCPVCKKFVTHRIQLFQ